MVVIFSVFFARLERLEKRTETLPRGLLNEASTGLFRSHR